MSVLVKGMKMPQKCGECNIRYEMFCQLLHRFIADEGRHHNCPLVEVVRTGVGLYDTFMPPDKEIAKHVTEVFRKSTERMEAEE